MIHKMSAITKRCRKTREDSLGINNDTPGALVIRPITGDDIIRISLQVST